MVCPNFKSKGISSNQSCTEANLMLTRVYLHLELGLGPCRAGLARPSRVLCRVGFRFLGTIGTSCRAVLARQVYYKAQARPMARRHAFVPCRPKHGPPDTCNWIYMHRYRNIIIAIRKHINYPWYENYMIFLNE